MSKKKAARLSGSMIVRGRKRAARGFVINLPKREQDSSEAPLPPVETETPEPQEAQGSVGNMAAGQWGAVPPLAGANQNEPPGGIIASNCEAGGPDEEARAGSDAPNAKAGDDAPKAMEARSAAEVIIPRGTKKISPFIVSAAPEPSTAGSEAAVGSSVEPSSGITGTAPSDPVARRLAAESAGAETLAETGAETRERPPLSEAQQVEMLQDLVQALRNGNLSQAEGIFVELTALPAKAALQILYGQDNQNLAVACRALGMEQLQFVSVFIMTRKLGQGQERLDPNELAQIVANFEQTEKAKAERILKEWRSQLIGGRHDSASYH